MLVEAGKRDLVSSVYELGKGIEDAHTLIYNGFVNNNERVIDEAEERIRKVKEEAARLSSELLGSCGDDESLRAYCTLPSHFERMAANQEIMVRAIKTKIRENLLFSDRAITEINFIMNRLREIIDTLTDLILARNTYTVKYLIESEKEIERVASEYATLHEERLIEGICLPRSSGVYIMILDSVKRIAWNVRAIAEKLMK